MTAPHVDELTRYLDDAGLRYEVIAHAPTYSATADARATGTDPSDEAKTIVLRSNGGYRLAVIPASERLDIRKAREVLDEGHPLRLATEAEIEVGFPQFETGAVPPLGPSLPSVEILDRRLLARDHIVCAGGDHRHSIRLDPRDVLVVTDPIVADVCEE